VACGLAESGAGQAGDISCDLRTGYLLEADPQAQFYGQVISSAGGVFMSVVLYRLYTAAYTISGKLYPIPVAQVSMLTAQLASGEGLPLEASRVALCFGIFFRLDDSAEASLCR
jgi:uncharacterized oligopeptide transporter (OPT) family protein